MKQQPYQMKSFMTDIHKCAVSKEGTAADQELKLAKDLALEMKERIDLKLWWKGQSG